MKVIKIIILPIILLAITMLIYWPKSIDDAILVAIVWALASVVGGAGIFLASRFGGEKGGKIFFCIVMLATLLNPLQLLGEPAGRAALLGMGAGSWVCIMIAKKKLKNVPSEQESATA